MRAAKRVVQYLKGLMHIGLVYDQKAIGDPCKGGLDSPSTFGLIGFANSTLLVTLKIASQ